MTLLPPSFNRSTFPIGYKAPLSLATESQSHNCSSHLSETPTPLRPPSLSMTPFVLSHPPPSHCRIFLQPAHHIAASAVRHLLKAESSGFCFTSSYRVGHRAPPPPILFRSFGTRLVPNSLQNEAAFGICVPCPHTESCDIDMGSRKWELPNIAASPHLRTGGFTRLISAPTRRLRIEMGLCIAFPKKVMGACLEEMGAISTGQKCNFYSVTRFTSVLL
jgi:hypothetical protein